jgi:hypothetical protein
MIIEQMTLLVLILSRWLLPKGELTREELSQLLLVNNKLLKKNSMACIYRFISALLRI